MSSLLEKLFLPIFKRLLEIYHKLEYTTIKIKGKDVTFPRHLKLLEIFGYGFEQFNFKRLAFFQTVHMIALLGEFYSIYLKWGTQEMFSGFSSSAYGARNVFVSCFMIKNRKMFRDMLATYANEIWVSKTTDYKTHSKCEDALLLNKLLTYIAIPIILVYAYDALYTTFVLKEDGFNFPLTVDYPFDVRHEMWRYILCYVLAFVAVVVRGTTIANFNLLLSYLLTYTSHRLNQTSDLLQFQEKKRDGIDDDFAYKFKVNTVVRKHGRLISFCKTLQQMFSGSVFVQFTAEAFPICALGLSVMVAQSLSGCVKYIMFLIFIFGSQYVNCVCGEQLIQASQRIGHAAYNSHWTGESLKVNACLKLIILRAQHPLKITGYDFFDLSMETFATVLKRTMSYFTLLKTFFE